MLGNCRKVFHAGTHRTVTPENTLARVLPLADRMGVTRIGNLTGLDVLGIPVCMACRPNSRSLAVFQGKGLTLAAAKASALMEAAEVFHAETIDAPLRFASYEEIRSRVTAIDPELLARPRDLQATAHARFLWIEGRDLASGEPVWVPYEVVSADYAWPQPPGGGGFVATTNGLGSGNHLLEAIAHGLYESIERDSVTLWRLGGASARAARRIDPASIEANAVQELIARFDGAGIHLGLWDATSDVEVATIVCLALDDPAADAGSDPELGAGCHPDREVAILRAITEAAQVRTTFIAGSRDDFEPSAFEESRRGDRLVAARAWSAGKATRDWREIPTFSSQDIAVDLAWVLERLRACGLDRVVWVDLAKPDLDLPVARVIVPGLEAPHQVDARPGRRAQAVCKEPGAAWRRVEAASEVDDP
jgi:ribosomal protein S12 methylthiotransferase accessory factor